jgi:hypothetical protein
MTASIIPSALKTRNPNLPIPATFRDDALRDALAFYDFATFDSATVMTDLSGRGNAGTFSAAPTITADGWSLNGTTYFDMPDDLGDTAVAHFFALKTTGNGGSFSLGGNQDQATKKGYRLFLPGTGGTHVVRAELAQSNNTDQVATEANHTAVPLNTTAIWMFAVYQGRGWVERISDGTVTILRRKITVTEAGLPLPNGIRWGGVRNGASPLYLPSTNARLGALLTIDTPRGFPSQAKKAACAALIRDTMAARGIAAV